MADSIDLDEVAHYEPPHQDLCCLQIQLFSSLVLKRVKLLVTFVIYEYKYSLYEVCNCNSLISG